MLERWDDEYRKLPWEAFGAHYLQMVGAMGGAHAVPKASRCPTTKTHVAPATSTSGSTGCQERPAAAAGSPHHETKA